MLKLQFILVSVFLTACSVQSLQGVEGVSSQSLNVQEESDWQNLGVTINGNQMIEVDRLSVRRISSNSYSFRSRTTIFNPDLVSFGSVPEHRQAVNIWQVNCSDYSLRLVGTRLYDFNQDLISDIKLNRTVRVQDDTGLESQFLYICQGEYKSSFGVES